MFYHAFKGARQLHPSKGFRKLLGLGEEKTDQQLAEEEMDKAAALLATLTDEQRHDLVKTKSLPALLSLAEDAPGLIPDFLESLRTASPEPHQGEGEPGTTSKRKSE